MCDCDRALELISLRLDGALLPEEAGELEEHLEHCPPCRSLAQELEALHRAMPELEEEPPADLHRRIVAAVEQEPRRPAAPSKKVWRTWQRWGSLAAVFAVIIAGAGLLPSIGGGGSSGGAAPHVASGGTDSLPGDGGESSAKMAPTDDSAAPSPAIQGSGGDSLPESGEEEAVPKEDGAAGAQTSAVPPEGEKEDGPSTQPAADAPPAQTAGAGGGEPTSVQAPALYQAAPEAAAVDESVRMQAAQGEAAAGESVQAPAPEEEDVPQADAGVDAVLDAETAEEGSVSSQTAGGADAPGAEPDAAPGEEARAAMEQSALEWLSEQDLAPAEEGEISFARPTPAERSAGQWLGEIPEDLWKVTVPLSGGESAVLFCDGETCAVAGALDLPSGN